MSKKDYSKQVQQYIELVGGSVNISSLTHCVTRLRFAIKDKSLVKMDEIKKVEGTMGCQWAGEQFQIIIGGHVSDVYDAMCDTLGIDKKPSVEATLGEEKKSFKDKLLGTLSGIFLPAMPLIIGGGMIKAFCMMFLSLGLVNPASGMFTLMMAIGDAPFKFMPLVLGYSTAKQFKMNPMLGMGIGAALMYNSIQGVDIDLFGFTVNATYEGTILPIIFVVIFGSYVERFARKISPKLLSSFLIPVITFVVTVPIGFALIGPVFNAVAQGICDGIMWLYSNTPVVAASILGAFWQILVVFGMHSVFSSIAVMQLTSGTGTPILAMIFPAFFAQAMTVWAICLKTKSEKLRSVSMSAGISALLGVTEPAIYSVTLPRLKYFIISCIGTMCGAIVMALTGTLRYSLGGLGFFCIPTFFGEGVSVTSVLISIAISLVAAGLVSFVLTFITYKDAEADLENE